MNKNGFTLIELLVSISIIAVLTTLGVVNFMGVRERARDAQRKANVNELRTAFEFYKIDNGAYPVSLPACGTALTNVSGTTYMQKMPCDPSTKALYYYSRPTATTFVVAACLENDNDQDACVGAGCPAGVSCVAGYVPYVGVNP